MKMMRNEKTAYLNLCIQLLEKQAWSDHGWVTGIHHTNARTLAETLCPVLKMDRKKEDVLKTILAGRIAGPWTDLLGDDHQIGTSATDLQQAQEILLNAILKWYDEISYGLGTFHQSWDATNGVYTFVYNEFDVEHEFIGISRHNIKAQAKLHAMMKIRLHQLTE